MLTCNPFYSGDDAAEAHAGLHLCQNYISSFFGTKCHFQGGGTQPCFEGPFKEAILYKHFVTLMLQHT